MRTLRAVRCSPFVALRWLRRVAGILLVGLAAAFGGAPPPRQTRHEDPIAQVAEVSAEREP